MNEITISPETEAALDRYIQSMMEDFNLNREEMIEHLIGIGICAVLHNKSQKLQSLAKARHVIPKLKAGAEVSNAELEDVVKASRDGDIESKVIMSDIERFGRSIEKP